ncbi:MAG: hypothetical protein DRG71_01625 [Deltaproteobacteria bacterium]|nr:MAG: hypothetical protein DRG71_01625 [Deltaproteobacteria bacterium]
MRVKEITSEHNPFLKKLLKLKTSRGIRKFEMALLSGEKNVREVLNEFPSECLGIITFSLELLKSLALESDLPVYLTSRKLFQQLDFHNTKNPILIIKAQAFDQWTEQSADKGCILFLPFQDPANLGAAIRSGAAFGVKTVVVLEEAAHPFHPKSLRASGSSIFRVRLKKGPSISDLDTHRLPLLVLDPQGKNISHYEFPDSFALVAGLEGPGIPEALKGAESLAIPIRQEVDSLNAALAIGIALYQWRISQEKRGVL